MVNSVAVKAGKQMKGEILDFKVESSSSTERGWNFILFGGWDNLNIILFHK